MPPAQISLTHFYLSFIASDWSSGLHPVSSHGCCMYVRAGRPAFAWPHAGVHRSTSLMSSSLLLQQRPACLVRLTCIYICVFVCVCVRAWEREREREREGEREREKARKRETMTENKNKKWKRALKRKKKYRIKTG